MCWKLLGDGIEKGLEVTKNFKEYRKALEDPGVTFFV